MIKVKELDIYEVLYLVNPNFTDEELENKIEFYRNFVIKNGSSAAIKNCGKKDLSYNLKKQTSANYIQMVYVGNNKIIESINQEMNRDEQILRHFTTKLIEIPEM